MILYHGTVLAFANAIKEKGIDTEKNKKAELDFGKGLYISDEETAVLFAQKKVTDIKTWKSIPNEMFLVPVVVPIEIDEGKFHSLKILELKKKNLKWLRFVYDTRKYHKETTYDIIVGAIADGAIDEIMSRVSIFPDVIARIVAYLHFLRKENKGHYQYVLKTKRAVDIAKVLTPYRVALKGDD